jgi:acetyl-CoA carboxylase biotin carboxyl carrier protein
MDLQKIKALIDLLAESPLERLEVIEGEERVKLVKTKRRGKRGHAPRGNEGAVAMAQPFEAPTPAAASAHAATGDATATAAEQCTTTTTTTTADAQPELVRAPMFGIVHLTPSPDEPPFVQVGDTVGEGDVLCTIEAMKMFNAIESDCRGIVREVLVAPGSEVESGQPLFRIG